MAVSRVRMSQLLSTNRANDWPASCSARDAMMTILLDPSLRRARIVRATVAVLACAAVGTVALCAFELRARDRPAPSLPSPRRGSKSAGRRPPFGQRPISGPHGPLRPPSTAATHAIAPRGIEQLPRVTAFIDPSLPGALTSLQRHGSQISTLVVTGALVGDDGALIDQIDRGVLQAAAAAHVPAMILLQNLDERDGSWRADRVRALARDGRARARLATELVRLCARIQAVGVHLDLEDLGDQWQPFADLATDLAPRMRSHGLKLAADVPSTLATGVLAELGRTTDEVVVMAYDEHDADAAPGAIASDDFVADALATVARTVPPAKLTAGLAIYGYDWIDSAPAEPISFVDAHAAAKEAHVEPRWDGSGNVRFQYVDDEGHHQVWLTDAASVWNQARLADAAGIHAVAMWRLGGEDPGVWEALAHLTEVPPIDTVEPDDRVANQGDGPFLSLALPREAGRRALRSDGERIIEERWLTSPSPYLVRRAGTVPGQVALTFDDGPDPRFTAAILDILRREQVPASFFVIGTQAAAAPALLRRAYDEGHEIGNHSLTHPNVDAVGALRLRTELEGTSQVIESIIGRRSLMYRPPSLADVEPRTSASATAFARAGSLGYLVVDADVDPRDWRQPSVEELTQRTLAQATRGGVILLHDGGGDRSTTVRALPGIIAGLRARGLHFVALSQLIGKRRNDVMPLPATRGVGHALPGYLLRFAMVLRRWLRLLSLGILAMVALRALAMLVAALVAERRRCGAQARGPLPSVTAVIPAFNEGPVIERTIDSVLASDVPIDVVVIDDGSTDDTAEVVARRFRREPRVRLIRQANAGKAAALRAGFAVCRTEVVVALDGDTLFSPNTIRRLIEPMLDPRVGAVAGTAEVGNLENVLARWQAVEYLAQQELERRAWDAFGAVPIVPGAVGAWRRRAVLDEGGFSSETLAEDADLAMTLCRGGWRVVHAASARACTEVPTTLGALVKQRVRWTFGVLQALWKHRHAVVAQRAGAFGRVVWPLMLLFQVGLPLATPLALLSVAFAAIAGNFRGAIIAAALLFGVETVQFVAACVLARRAGAARSWTLAPSLLTARLFYRPLLLLIALRSVGRLVDGVPLGWGKLARRNTAVAFATATAGVRARVADQGRG